MNYILWDDYTLIQLIICIKQRMGFSKIVKSCILKLDFFVTTQVFRVNSEPDYKTLVGGIASIAIIIALSSMFYSRIYNALNKVIVDSSFNTNHFNNPQPIQLSTFGDGKFMFGVEIWKHDLNTGKRYFDVMLRNIYYTNGDPMINNSKTVNVTLQPCTRQHWASYPDILQKFDRIQMGYWKCLPKNSVYDLYGKFSSVQSMTLDVAVLQCTNNTQDVRPCASPQEINDFFLQNGNFYYTIYFLNALINPSSHNYLKYYLQDSNYIIFDRNGGQEAQLFVQDYTITTDESIFLFSDQKIQKGGVITNNAIKNRYNSLNGLYGTFFFFKSTRSQIISRSFQKIDDVLAYVGGLFGTITMLLYMVDVYNQYAFEITMAGYLYHREDNDQPNLYKDYNFLYFLGQSLYSILIQFKIEPNWPNIKAYYNSSSEVVRQLDILYLFKRINFLQRSLQYLMSDHQIKGLHLMKRLTLQQAKQIRLKYKTKSKIKKEMMKRQRELNKNCLKQDFIKCEMKQPTYLNTNYIIDIKQQNNMKNVNHPNTKENQYFAQQQEVAFVQEDCYTSQSQQQDQSSISLVQSMKVLAQQKTSNDLSLKIWQNMDKKVKDMLAKQMNNEQGQGFKIENEFDFQDLLLPQVKSQLNKNFSSEKALNVGSLNEFNSISLQKPVNCNKVHRKAIRKILRNESMNYSLFSRDKTQLKQQKIQSESNFQQF